MAGPDNAASLSAQGLNGGDSCGQRGTVRRSEDTLPAIFCVSTDERKAEAMRKEFEMPDEDLARLLQAAKPVPMIALQCGTPRSVQENANAAWAELGARMGFDPMTVSPNGKGNRFFTAVEKCRGIEIEQGVFSGCDASDGDCPACGQ